MRPGWNAASVRARSLASRRLGGAATRALASTGSLRDAVALLAASPYRHAVTEGADLAAAQHGVRATALWDLRVLAGWLPPGGSDVIRVLAGMHEIANVEGLLDALAGARAAEPPFVLGALATAWPRVRGARSPNEVRAALAHSLWGDPGSSERAAVSAALRVAWGRRIADAVPALRRWASAWLALVVAAERFGAGRELHGTATLDARRALGPGWAAPRYDGFVAGLPVEARWLFADLPDEQALWRAEAHWWARLASEAGRRMRHSGRGDAVVAWAGASILADAQRVCGALEAVPWGATGAEVFDGAA